MNPRCFSIRLTARLLAIGFALLSASMIQAGIVKAVYNSAKDIPVTATSYSAAGIIVNFTLNFAPTAGTNLTVVNLTTPGALITGTCANLTQNQVVPLTYNGQTYNFVANYFGGTGNDLVLQWAGTRALAWGGNYAGKLGNGSTTASNLPVAVTSTGVLVGKRIVALSAGDSHSIALCSDGTVAAWGANYNGQLGNGTTTNSSVPIQINSFGALASKRVIAIAAGSNHSLALCSDGTVAAWGVNSYGQLGNGTYSSSSLPAAVYSGGVLSGKQVVAVSAGQYFNLALLSDGTMASWGESGYGQLGRTGDNALPGLVTTTGVLFKKTITSLTAGIRHSIALCSDGTLAAWGDNSYGQLGNTSMSTSTAPVKVTTAGTYLTGRTVVSIVAGGFHNLALCTDGTLASWGANYSGQLGIASGSNLLPAGVSTTGALLNKTVTSMVGGASHSLALCSDGTLASWGANGQLGTSNNTQSNVPQLVSAAALLTGEKFMLPASGPMASHSFAIVASPYSSIQLTTGTLISNGSFENGFVNWSVSDINSPANPLQIRTGGYYPGEFLFLSEPTEGTHAATSGFEGYGPGIIRLAHDVAVTSAEPFIRFDWRAGWDMLSFSGSTKPRTFAVTIEPSGGGPVMQTTTILTALPHTKNLDNGPQTGFVDLSAYIGTTVRVCFDLIVPEAKAGRAFFQLDNVRTAGLQPASINPITQAATGVSIEGATLNGLVNANGNSTTVQFEYGTSTAYNSALNSMPFNVSGSADTPVSVSLSGLALNTNYHYRVTTSDVNGTKVGADGTFTTLPHEPVFSGFIVNDIRSTIATPSANINPNDASTVVTFEYGLTMAYGSTTTALESPITTPATVHCQISGLTGGTTYHYRFKAVNAGGTTYSSDTTFTTLATQPGDPTVITQQPTRVNSQGATLNGSANANGSTDVGVDFEFGITTNYDSTVKVTPSSVSGSSDTTFQGTLGSLNLGTSYHYRGRALGPNGYVFGPEVSFTTPAIGFPSASTDEVFDITQTHAYITGLVSANNGPQTNVIFEYGLDANYGTSVTVSGSTTSTDFVSVGVQVPVSGDNVTYHYRVKATNNIGTVYGQDKTFATPDMHEARLQSLGVNRGSLSPVFDKNVNTYTLSVPYEAMELTLTPLAPNGVSSVLINGVSVDSGSTTSPYKLTIGSQSFTIVATALDGVTQQTYTVTVTRAAPSAGSLDFSYNTTGSQAVQKAFIYDHGQCMAFQPDGRIVYAGYAYYGSNYNFILYRFNPDGSTDFTFGDAGRVITDFGGTTDFGTDVAVQPDGKIIVAGQSYSDSSKRRFAVARYNSDGSLDTTFNSTGKVTTAVGTDAYGQSLVLQSDGKIVVAGTSDNAFAVVRYNANGSLDTTFNTTGIVITPVSASDAVSSVALQSDGRVVVAGTCARVPYGTGSLFGIVRYTTDGTLDATFNSTGMTTVAISTSGEYAQSVAIQSDGNILLQGISFVSGQFYISMLRLQPDGAPDNSFGSAGKVTTDITGSVGAGRSLALASSGKILVSSTSSNTFQLSRFITDGTLDTNFQGTGKALAPLQAGLSADAVCLGTQGDGKVVIAGNGVDLLSNQQFILARFLGDGPAISVELPVNTALFDGISSANLGGAQPGSSRDVVFTLRNTGAANLSSLAFSIDGLNASEFSLVGVPTGPLSAQNDASFTIRFTPSVLGVRSAALHILSNVTGNMHSFDLGLVANGLVAVEDWRFNRFGNDAGNLAIAGDNADPNHNGIPNILEYALNGDPAGNTTGNALLPQAAQGAGNALQLNFSRYLDRNDITITVQACDDLSGMWSDLARSVNGAPFVLLDLGATVNETGTGNTRAVLVGDLYPVNDPAHPHRFMRLQVTRP